MPINPNTKQIKKGRDMFNKNITPVIGELGEPYDGRLLKIRNVMNRDVNQLIRDINSPGPVPVEGYPEIHGHFLGFWIWFMTNAWKGMNEQETIAIARETIREAKKHRVSLVDGFFFLSSGRPDHSFANTKTPWIFQNGKFNFDQFSPRFWYLLQKWLELYRDEGMAWMPKLLMGFGYNLFPFRNNVQGIKLSKVWQKDGWEVVRAMVLKIISVYRTVYGDDYVPRISPNNEFAHNGRCDYFHEIGYYHEFIALDVLKDIVPLTHFVADASHCDAVRMEIAGPISDCPKPECCDRGKKHGLPEFNRDVVAEDHAYSTIEDLYTKRRPGDKPPLQNFLGSANRRWRPTEDAGGFTKNGKGENWENKYFFADAEQMYVMAKELFSKVKEKDGNPHPKSVEYGIFPVETLQGGHELNYDKSIIHWDRFDALRRAREEVYGTEI